MCSAMLALHLCWCVVRLVVVCYFLSGDAAQNQDTQTNGANQRMHRISLLP